MDPKVALMITDVWTSASASRPGCSVWGRSPQPSPTYYVANTKQNPTFLFMVYKALSQQFLLCGVSRAEIVISIFQMGPSTRRGDKYPVIQLVSGPVKLQIQLCLSPSPELGPQHQAGFQPVKCIFLLLKRSSDSKGISDSHTMKTRHPPLVSGPAPRKGRKTDMWPVRPAL